MASIMAVALGGAIGAVLRYMIVTVLANFSLILMPLGVILCNIVGSFLLGIVIAWSLKDPLITENMKTFLQVGILGAFTTFSTFALEVFYITEKGQYFVAIIYILLSLVLSIGGFFVGMNIFRLIG